MTEWAEARQKRIALQNEIDQPTKSRLRDAQEKLVQSSEAAGAKSHDLLVRLRVLRRKRKEKAQGL